MQYPIRGFIMSVLAVLLMVGAVRLVWGLFTGEPVVRAAVQMTPEDSGTVSVGLEGGLLQRAEDQVSLYPDDRVVTASTAHASLSLFDGTTVRLDEGTSVTIRISEEGETSSDASVWEIFVEEGRVWVRVPADAKTATRRVSTPFYTASIPLESDALLATDLLLVYEASDEGIAVQSEENGDPAYIAEGQATAIERAGETKAEIIDSRRALRAGEIEHAFVAASRSVSLQGQGSGGSASADDESGSSTLTVTEPSQDASVAASTITVSGTVDDSVSRVRINGYLATLDDGTFEQELALDDEETTILVEALDENGIVLERVRRNVTRSNSSSGGGALASPKITTPAAQGQTYNTDATEIEIRGTAPMGTAGIVVNDYRLQLFREGDETWSYLASIALGNMRQGVNTYSVVALDDEGKASTPAVLTVVVGSQNTSTPPAQSNAPLTPGILSVTGPQSGGSYTSTGTGFLLEGTTSADTASMWVNDYQLQLYEAGNTYWNYIAREDYGNLSEGTNTYLIIARDAQGRILDRLQYTVTHVPAE